MFIRKTLIGKNKNDFNIYLVERYRDQNGRTKQRILIKFGLLSKLTENNPNEFEELREKYKKMSKIELIEIKLK